jgi:hypothetical protein
MRHPGDVRDCAGDRPARVSGELNCDRHPVGTADEALWSLLYRYWFWGWLFEDVNRGDALRRRASWRHNLAMRSWLPTYMARWLACGAVAAGAAHALQATTATVVMPAMFYTGAVLAVVVLTNACTAWMFLARGQQPG